MCGRYYRAGDKQALADAFRAGTLDSLDEQPAFAAAYNIAPTTTQPVIRQSRDSSARELVGMRWGLVGFGSAGPDLKRATFNARAENLSRSPLWRTPLHKRRCLIPISGYYEWAAITRQQQTSPVLDGSAAVAPPKGDLSARDDSGRSAARTKQPYRFSIADRPYFALAGLWDAWQTPAGDWLQSMSIITVAASPVMLPFHDRMPAILSPEHYDQWLDRAETERPPTHLLRPYTGTDMLIHQAHASVGNIRNQGPELLNSA